MKINKIQKEIFDSILKDGNIWAWKVSETETAFTTDGHKAFVIPDKVISFNLNKVKMADELIDMFKPNDDDKQLIVTNDLKIVSGNRICRKLKCQEGESIRSRTGEAITEIWVNNKFLDYFINPKLFAYEDYSRVAVKDTSSDDICAVMLPFRVSND